MDNRRGVLWISPPTWRWPAFRSSEFQHINDFPTHVGMARNAKPTAGRTSRFPHPRGDGPRDMCGNRICILISPPTWGWPNKLPMTRASDPLDNLVTLGYTGDSRSPNFVQLPSPNRPAISIESPVSDWQRVGQRHQERDCGDIGGGNSHKR